MTSSQPQPVSQSELPLELDFFRYTKRKHDKTHEEDENTSKSNLSESPSKKRKISPEREEAKLPSPKQRIVTKGSKVPDAVDTFASLQERYSFPPRLLQNLETHGYKHPTGIQSQGSPIMLEVTYTAFTSYALF